MRSYEYRIIHKFTGSSCIKNVICDIDGVLMHDNVAPGAAERRGFWKGLPLVLLTSTRRKPAGSGEPFLLPLALTMPDSVFYTSAMATADFLRRQEGKKRMSWARRSFTRLYRSGFYCITV